MPALNPCAAISPETWRVICDFDGTITPFDVTDALLGAFAHPSWEDVERQWLDGLITARQCMEKQVGLLRVSRRALDAWLDAVPVMDGFHGFMKLCERNGLPFTVVSDGLDYAIRRILSRHGLDGVHVIANSLRIEGDAAYRLEFPHGGEGCASGVCKCGVGRSLGGRILLIGDGRSDCCLAGEASLIIAREGMELQKHCEDNGYQFLTFADFSEISSMLEDTLTRQRTPEAERPTAFRFA